MMPKLRVKEGTSGTWAVEQFTVSTDDAKINNLRAALGSARPLPEGTYWRLGTFHRLSGLRVLSSA